MPKYLVNVSWEMAGSVEVDADTAEDAIDVARESPLPDGEYISCSFRIDTIRHPDGTEEVVEE